MSTCQIAQATGTHQTTIARDVREANASPRRAKPYSGGCWKSWFAEVCRAPDGRRFSPVRALARFYGLGAGGIGGVLKTHERDALSRVARFKVGGGLVCLPRPQEVVCNRTQKLPAR